MRSCTEYQLLTKLVDKETGTKHRNHLIISSINVHRRHRQTNVTDPYFRREASKAKANRVGQTSYSCGNLIILFYLQKYILKLVISQRWFSERFEKKISQLLWKAALKSLSLFFFFLSWERLNHPPTSSLIGCPHVNKKKGRKPQRISVHHQDIESRCRCSFFSQLTDWKSYSKHSELTVSAGSISRHHTHRKCVKVNRTRVHQPTASDQSPAGSRVSFTQRLYNNEGSFVLITLNRAALVHDPVPPWITSPPSVKQRSLSDSLRRLWSGWKSTEGSAGRTDQHTDFNTPTQQWRFNKDAASYSFCPSRLSAADRRRLSGRNVA